MIIHSLLFSRCDRLRMTARINLRRKNSNMKKQKIVFKKTCYHLFRMPIVIDFFFRFREAAGAPDQPAVLLAVFLFCSFEKPNSILCMLKNVRRKLNVLFVHSHISWKKNRVVLVFLQSFRIDNVLGSAFGQFLTKPAILSFR